jgi:uncharacterized protein (DUF983 family)
LLDGGKTIQMSGFRLSDALFFLDGAQVPVRPAWAVAAATQPAVNGTTVQALGVAPLRALRPSQRRRVLSLEHAQQAQHASTRAASRRLLTTGSGESFVAPAATQPGFKNVTVILPVIPLPGQFPNVAGWVPTLDNTMPVYPNDTRLAARYPCASLAACKPAEWALHLSGHRFDAARLFLYSASRDENCLLEGFYLFNNDGGVNGTAACRPCPEGAFCPGGGTALPVRGYWSTSAFLPPVQCVVAAACVGAVTVSSVDGSCIADVNFANADGDGNGDGTSALTQRCGEGYAGFICSECASGFYKDIQVCRSCGLDAAARFYIVVVFIVAGAMFVGMALMVALFRSTRMASYVGTVIVIQQGVTVLQSAAQELPDSARFLVDTINLVSIINFGTLFVCVCCMCVCKFVCVPRSRF